MFLRFLKLKMTNYDRTRFMSTNCQPILYEDLTRRKLLPRWAISLEKMPKNIPTIYERLVAIGWRCFTQDPCWDNKHWVRGFYVNLSIVKISKPVMRIWGKEIHSRAELINKVFGLLNAKYCAPRN